MVFFLKSVCKVFNTLPSKGQAYSPSLEFGLDFLIQINAFYKRNVAYVMVCDFLNTQASSLLLKTATAFPSSQLCLQSFSLPPFSAPALQQLLLGPFSESPPHHPGWSNPSGDNLRHPHVILLITCQHLLPGTNSSMS